MSFKTCFDCNLNLAGERLAIPVHAAPVSDLGMCFRSQRAVLSRCLGSAVPPGICSEVATNEQTSDFPPLSLFLTAVVPLVTPVRSLGEVDVCLLDVNSIPLQHGVLYEL